MQAPSPLLRGKPWGRFSRTKERHLKGKLAKNTLSNYYYRLRDETDDDPGGLTGRLLRSHFAISRKIGPRVTIDQVRKGAEREKQTAKTP